MEGLSGLKGSGKVQGGLCRYPDGREYYRYLVYSSTYTSCRDVTTLRKTIERRIERDFRELASIVARRQDLLDSLPDVSFAFTEPHEILRHLMEQTALSYPAPICEDYTIRYVPKALEPVLSPAFYLTPPIDRDGSNTIYINQGSASSGQDHLFTTLAHEGYPGHLYQTVYFGKQDCPPIRHLLGCSGYVEGWATYVENMAYEYSCCFLQTDPEVMEFLRLNRSVTLCLYSILDIGIHDTGWNLQTVQELLKSFGITDENACREIFQYIVENPANYLKYYLGFLNFTALKSNVQEIQGTDFNLKLFHQNLLEIGPAPFPIVKKYLLMRY